MEIQDLKEILSILVDNEAETGYFPIKELLDRKIVTRKKWLESVFEMKYIFILKPSKQHINKELSEYLGVDELKIDYYLAADDMFNKDGTATLYQPTLEDLFADDWIIIDKNFK